MKLEKGKKKKEDRKTINLKMQTNSELADQVASNWYKLVVKKFTIYSCFRLSHIHMVRYFSVLKHNKQKAFEKLKLATRYIKFLEMNLSEYEEKVKEYGLTKVLFHKNILVKKGKKHSKVKEGKSDDSYHDRLRRIKLFDDE